MKNKYQNGFSLTELLVVVVILALIGVGIVLLFNRKAKTSEDEQIAAIANAGAENALEALAEQNDLTFGGSFSVSADNEISLDDKCIQTNCDWLVIPSDVSNSPAKGVLFTKTQPTGKTILLRRWKVENVDSNLGLRKITVAVLTDAGSTKPIVLLTTTVGKK